jgi:predicted RNA-binding Zn ribbon-like protein
MELMVRTSTDDETFLLDLLNSTPIADGEQHDALGEPASAQQWLRRHGGTGSAAERQHTIAARDLLQAVVRGEISAAKTAKLAALVEDVTSRPSITNDGVEWSFDVAEPRRPALRAVLAWDELRRNSPGRLRPCGNPECALFLIDHSKPNTARWCSMAVCGNRMKARRHYERTRAGR